MILPKEIYEIIKKDFFVERSPIYSRVILPLKALVEGDFFTEYIKKGKNSFRASKLASSLTGLSFITSLFF